MALIQPKDIPPPPVRDWAERQVSFRKDLMRVFRWLLRLRWMAAGGGFISSWAIYSVDRAFPLLPVQGTLVFICGYNTILHFLWRRMNAAAPSTNDRSFWRPTRKRRWIFWRSFC